MAGKANIPTERSEQRHFVKWFYLQYPKEKLAKFYNDGVRGSQHGAIMALEGLLPGVPDVMIFVPRGGYNGLLIEFKRKTGGVVSEIQAKIMQHLNARGYKAIVCCGWEQARDATIEYMKLLD